jgi:aminoglycoside 6'-N-acetyltransferase
MWCTVVVISLPLTSDRLTIRMMRSEHLASLLEYRNSPEVTRYQDWPAPFTAAMGERLISGQSGLDGPVDGTWVQLAVELDGRAIGDVAVGIHDEGRQATVGYSITVSEQGKGYAIEAVSAVVAALFAEPGMHRIGATIDPGNSASRRVLEKLGFRFEGQALQAVFVRGEWVDDDRFALLASEHFGQGQGDRSSAKSAGS